MAIISGMFAHKKGKENKTMKTLTNEQTTKINELYKKYEAAENKIPVNNECAASLKSASTKAYKKLVNYIESVTNEPAHKIIFRLTNA